MPTAAIGVLADPEDGGGSTRCETTMDHRRLVGEMLDRAWARRTPGGGGEIRPSSRAHARTDRHGYKRVARVSEPVRLESRNVGEYETARAMPRPAAAANFVDCLRTMGTRSSWGVRALLPGTGPEPQTPSANQPVADRRRGRTIRATPRVSQRLGRLLLPAGVVGRRAAFTQAPDAGPRPPPDSPPRSQRHVRTARCWPVEARPVKPRVRLEEGVSQARGIRSGDVEWAGTGQPTRKSPPCCAREAVVAGGGDARHARASLRGRGCFSRLHEPVPVHRGAFSQLSTVCSRTARWVEAESVARRRCPWTDDSVDAAVRSPTRS